jgi:C-methyltransferase
LARLQRALARLFMPAGIRRMVEMGDLLTGAWVSRAIGVAASLRVADHIGGSPVPVSDLARACAANDDALYRLLRMLATAGLFRQWPGRRFSLTPLGELLRSDHPNSMRAFAAYNGDPWHWRMWGELERSVRTGTPSAAGDAGDSLFAFLAKDAHAAASFDAAMADLSNARDVSAISGYDFAQYKTVVDVGGGEGQLVRSVLKAFPTVSGVLYDLPEVTARAAPKIERDGLSARCRLIAGSFFDSVPAGGDAYMLKQVLHDWPDDKAIAILRNCRRALQTGGKVLIFEFVVPDDDGPSLGKLSDIEMLAITGGRERTLREYKVLLDTAGMGVVRAHDTRSPFTIIEAEVTSGSGL